MNAAETVFDRFDIRRRVRLPNQSPIWHLGKQDPFSMDHTPKNVGIFVSEFVFLATGRVLSSRLVQ